jgi:MFS family permease
MQRSTITKFVVEATSMFVVAALSLFLLLYVGFADGKRTFEQLHVETMTAQARTIQLAIEKFLRDGLPLKQYAGFSTLANPITEGEDVDALIVYDDHGRQLFASVDKHKPKMPEPAEAIHRLEDKIIVYTGPTHYQIILPLRSRFETAGSLVIFAPTGKVAHRIYESFNFLPYLAAALSIVFALGVVCAQSYFAKFRASWLQIAYGITFVIMAVGVVGTLVTLYFDGIHGKAKAAAFVLSQRVGDVIEFKLKPDDFDGLDRAFLDYRKINPELSDAALVVDGKVQVTTDPSKLGKSWQVKAQDFEYNVGLSKDSKDENINLTVTVPRNVAFERVIRNVKNFAALFIASAFLAGLFLQVASSIRSSRQSNPGEKVVPDDVGLIIVKPIFFLAVFLDSLTYSFLPKFMQETAHASGVSVSFASLPFTAYYLCFALTLIPAGAFCDRRGSKPIIAIGLILAGLSVLALALPLGLWPMIAVRGMAGIGQGALLIGVQTYILAVASPEKKTQGASIIVFGFQGGLISGMALGSLLVGIVAPKGVFIIGACVALATLVYTLTMLARTAPKQADDGIGAAVRKLLDQLKNVITSWEFLNTLLCIGAPAKAILTGIITFALPLVLGHAGYKPEDIGQVVMLYGLGVVLSTGRVSRLVDRTKNTEMILFCGALMSGAGLFMIGLLGSKIVGDGALGTVVVVIGVALVGVAHGFINAPVTTHMGQSDLAKRQGANPVTTAYRFAERGGHILGPILLGQLFVLFGNGAGVLGGDIRFTSFRDAPARRAT